MDFDLLISQGTIIDGTRHCQAAVADVGILGDRIAAIGELSHCGAATVIDATGLVVTPGFIDVHVHSEIELLAGQGCHGSLRQGVTTHFTGADGFGWAPLPPHLGRSMWEYTLFAYGHPQLDVVRRSVAEYLALFASDMPVNVVPQAPHNAVRLAAMGWAPRPAGESDLDIMRRVTREWMEMGAAGLCIGLDYQPGGLTSTAELIELSRLVAEYDGVIAAHIRQGELGKEAAWQEMIQIARQAEVAVHISHEWVDDVTEPLLATADDCRLTFDSYLYPAGCTHLELMLPPWIQAGGLAEQRHRLQDPHVRQAAAQHLEKVLSEGHAAGERAVFIANQTGRFIGMDIVTAAGRTPLGDFAVSVLMEEDPYALMIFHKGWSAGEAEAAIRRTVRHPAMLVASDGIYHNVLPHPRAYGCFARVPRLCVREMGAISLAEAVYKMSGAPAHKFGLKDRGVLRPGLAADIVVFDAQTITDHATWDEPRLPPSGPAYVLVNGKIAVKNDRPTGIAAGRLLKSHA